MLRPTSSSTGRSQHLGERAVGVEDRRVVEANEGHAGGRRVERLLEAPPGLLERPHALLALGDVAQAHDRAAPGTSSSGSGRGRSWPRIERHGRAVGVRQAQRHRARLDASCARPATATRRGRCRVGGSTSSPNGRPARRAHGATGQLGRLGVGAAHDADRRRATAPPRAGRRGAGAARARCRRGGRSCG